MNFNQYQPQNPRRHDPIFFPLAKTSRARLSHALDTQWAQLASETIVIATTNNVWLYLEDSVDAARFARPMEDVSGSFASTQSLLDGAIMAAYHKYAHVILPDLTLPRWIWQFAGHYHLTCMTPKLLEAAAERFAIAERLSLTRWAWHKAEQERDCNLAALRDLEGLGYDAQAVICEMYPTQVSTLTDYLIEKSTDPIAYIGYIYAIERLATGIGVDYIQLVEGLLPPNPTSASRPWLYGSVGIEVEDALETVEAIAKLPAQERTRVAKACYDTAMLCFDRCEQNLVSDFELQLMLQALNA